MGQNRIFRSGTCLVLVFVLLTALVSPVAAFSGPQLDATGACVMDAVTGDVLWSGQGDTHHVPASLTKLMTVYLVFEAISDGAIAKDTPVPISSALAEFSRSSSWSNVPLYTYSTYTVHDLLNASVVSSACAATRALAELVGGSESAFVARMNQTAQDLGIDCLFYDTYGGSSRSYVTPNGLAELVYHLLDNHPDFLEYSSRRSYVLDGTTYYTTNQFLKGTYSCAGTVDGIKTGTSTPAGNCLCASAYRDNQRLITVVLNCSTDSSRYYDTQTLMSYGFDQLDAQFAAGGRYITPATLSLTVEGSPASLAVYTLDGVPYASPRDVAVLLQDTSGSFSVTDSGSETLLAPGRYEPDGSEGAPLLQRTRLAMPSDRRFHFVGGPDLPCWQADEQYYVNLFALLEGLGGRLTLDGASGVITLPNYVAPFVDVRESAWYSGAVEYVYANGIMNGTSDRTFAPEAELSRAMAVQVLYNMEDRPEAPERDMQFPDVSEDAWYAAAVRWAAGAGIVNGREDGTYAPEEQVTRQDIVSILYRYEAYKQADTSLRDDLSAYQDSATLADYALEPMQWAVAQGIISGMGDGTLQPLGCTTRAQMAQIMQNMTQQPAA